MKCVIQSLLSVTLLLVAQSAVAGDVAMETLKIQNEGAAKAGHDGRYILTTPKHVFSGKTAKDEKSGGDPDRPLVIGSPPNSSGARNAKPKQGGSTMQFNPSELSRTIEPKGTPSGSKVNNVEAVTSKQKVAKPNARKPDKTEDVKITMGTGMTPIKDGAILVVSAADGPMPAPVLGPMIRHALSAKNIAFTEAALRSLADQAARRLAAMRGPGQATLCAVSGRPCLAIMKR